MRRLSLSLAALVCAWSGTAAAGDIITSLRIKVQLFAAPAFFSEVSVDAYNNLCLSLDNNLYLAPLRFALVMPACPHVQYWRARRIDGRVQSILVGGHDVAAVLARDDYWYCQFFECVAPRPVTPAPVTIHWHSYSNYDCTADNKDKFLTFADGVNNLASIDWGTRIHSLRCYNQDPNNSWSTHYDSTTVATRRWQDPVATTAVYAKRTPRTPWSTCGTDVNVV
jgi:hypothetical protein